MKRRPGCTARPAYCLAKPYNSQADIQNCALTPTSRGLSRKKE
jgi:hypothetical protein